MLVLRGNVDVEKYQEPWIGLTSGAFFQYNINKTISLKSSIAFDRKSTCKTIAAVDENGQTVGMVDFVSNFDYLTLPILAKATFGNRIQFFINAGPYFSYLLKQTDKTNSDFFDVKKYDHTSLNNRIDYGVSTGLGITIPFKTKFAFSIEARNNLGLFDIHSESLISYGQVKTNSSNLLFGFIYRFGSM